MIGRVTNGTVMTTNGIRPRSHHLYSSADARNVGSGPSEGLSDVPMLNERLIPPITSTPPSASTVAVCPSRAVIRAPVAVKPSLSGANRPANAIELYLYRLAPKKSMLSTQR